MIEKAIKVFKPEDYDKRTVIGEFSGRDSVAAIVKAFESEDIHYILPVATFAGTEYGNYDVIYDNYEQLQKRVKKLYGDKKTLYPLLEYSREEIWGIMNGRVSNLLRDKYGFYSHCIGCHLYFHLTKLHFAKALSKRVISGERASHDGRIKVNQLDTSLNLYIRVMQKLGFELLMPLRGVSDGAVIQSLIGWDWKEGAQHPPCVLSGNYRDVSGKAVYDKIGYESLISSYLEPVGLCIGQYILDETQDLDSLKSEVMDLI